MLRSVHLLLSFALHTPWHRQAGDFLLSAASSSLCTSPVWMQAFPACLEAATPTPQSDGDCSIPRPWLRPTARITLRCGPQHHCSVLMHELIRVCVCVILHICGPLHSGLTLKTQAVRPQPLRCKSHPVGNGTGDIPTQICFLNSFAWPRLCITPSAKKGKDKLRALL